MLVQATAPDKSRMQDSGTVDGLDQTDLPRRFSEAFIGSNPECSQPTKNHAFYVLQGSSTVDTLNQAKLACHFSEACISSNLDRSLPTTNFAFSTLQDSSTVDALNQTDLPRRFSEARISSFQIEADLAVTPRLFYVHGEALERFAQMTNWDYYEAVSRFQKVLDAAGEASVTALMATDWAELVCSTDGICWRQSKALGSSLRPGSAWLRSAQMTNWKSCITRLLPAIVRLSGGANTFKVTGQLQAPRAAALSSAAHGCRTSCKETDASL